MIAWIDSLAYPPLLLVTALLLAAPVRPLPHVVEKLRMLRAGTLRRPLDIFDLFFHLAPLAVLILKAVRDLRP